MSSPNSSRPVDCAIVGGGVHGTYLAQRLLEETRLDRSDVAIVDPRDRLLESFREKARACGMETLRSSFVNHLGTEPFALESFAEGTDREDELVSTVDYPPRPTVELFLDHAERVIDDRDLESLHVREEVRAIRRTGDGAGLALETSAGTLEARTCVLAIGHGGRYRRPEWADGVEGVDHVWDGFEPDASAAKTVIVGGGITAAQLACELAETESVTLLSRHPLEFEVVEAEPPWLNWSHVERHLHVHPPGSERRLEAVRDARHDATIPPYLYAALEERREAGRLAVDQGEVGLARATGDGVELRLERGRTLAADRVALATGFEPVFHHPFVDRVADDLDLERGHRGMPVLADETLAWRDADGDRLPLYVSGALALGTVGPYAPNVPGARRAADRIAPAIDRRLARDRAAGTAPAPVRTDGGSAPDSRPE